MNKISKIITKILIVLLLCYGLILSFNFPAIAAIKRVEESPGQILYKSLQSWKDRDGNPWQVVFFKRIEKDHSTQINLRLVGFPDLIEFEHPQDLIIIIRPDLILNAPDVFVKESQSLAPNVGQYDFSPLVDQLESNNFWLLELPTKGKKSVTIRIPYFLLKEWEDIIQKS